MKLHLVLLEQLIDNILAPPNLAINTKYGLVISQGALWYNIHMLTSLVYFAFFEDGELRLWLWKFAVTRLFNGTSSKLFHCPGLKWIWWCLWRNCGTSTDSTARIRCRRWLWVRLWSTAEQSNFSHSVFSPVNLWYLILHVERCGGLRCIKIKLWVWLWLPRYK